MLTFDENQWRALQAADTRTLVATVCDQFLPPRPELLGNPGRKAIRDRMQAAYDYAQRVGFTSTPHVVWLMYMAADAPAFLADTVIEGYLSDASSTPEQRLDDRSAVMQKKLEEVL